MMQFDYSIFIEYESPSSSSDKSTSKSPKKKKTQRKKNHPVSYCTVFSPAYLRHIGPTSLQFRISFDMGIVLIQIWPQSPLKLCPAIVP